MGIVWGQKVRPEEINFYSNILSQEYVVFVRSVIKDGNAYHTGHVEKGHVLVSIDGEDVSGWTIEVVHTALDTMNIGSTVILEFFEKGTNMHKPVYAPRHELAQEDYTVEDTDEDMDEDMDSGEDSGEGKEDRGENGQGTEEEGEHPRPDERRR